jgi:hypothetical protein
MIEVFRTAGENRYKDAILFEYYDGLEIMLVRDKSVFIIFHCAFTDYDMSNRIFIVMDSTPEVKEYGLDAVYDRLVAYDRSLWTANPIEPVPSRLEESVEATMRRYHSRSPEEMFFHNYTYNILSPMALPTQTVSELLALPEEFWRDELDRLGISAMVQEAWSQLDDE